MSAESNIGPAQQVAGESPKVGSGNAVTAPLEDPAVGLLARYPVVAAALVLLLPAFGAMVAAITQGQTVAAVVLAGVNALIVTLTALVHRAVTPVAAPQLDNGVPLVIGRTTQ